MKQYQRRYADMDFLNKYFSETLCLGFLLFIFSNNCTCDERSHRVKRWLMFNKNSKFFARLNGKDNIVPWNTIITHGWGFRINYDLPDSENKKFKFFKRDIHSEIESIENPWGQQGYACLMKILCQMVNNIKASKTCGMFCEIGNIISQNILYIYQEMKLGVTVLWICAIIHLSQEVLDMSNHVKARQKRWIIWRPGINWVQMVVGIGLPIEVSGYSITWGAVLKSYYLLPNNASHYTDPFAWNDVTRKKRETSRWDLYSIMERFTESMGYQNGRACLLRAICELATAPLETKTGLLSEILHVLLTPSSTSETVSRHTDFEYHAAEEMGRKTENCLRLFPDCPFSLIKEFTKTLMHYI